MESLVRCGLGRIGIHFGNLLPSCHVKGLGMQGNVKGRLGKGPSGMQVSRVGVQFLGLGVGLELVEELVATKGRISAWGLQQWRSFGCWRCGELGHLLQGLGHSSRNGRLKSTVVDGCVSTKRVEATMTPTAIDMTLRMRAPDHPSSSSSLSRLLSKVLLAMAVIDYGGYRPR